MLPSTKTAIHAILSADSGIDKTQIKAALSVLDSKANAAAMETPSRILSRTEVGKLLGVSAKRIDQLAQQGTLRRIVMPGCSRAIGFSSEDIQKITAGAMDGGAV